MKDSLEDTLRKFALEHTKVNKEDKDKIDNMVKIYIRTYVGVSNALYMSALNNYIFYKEELYRKLKND